MTVKRKTSLTVDVVMNCQFEFMVTQCSVAYGEEEEKQNKTKKNYRFVMPYNLLSCFADYLLRFMIGL